MVESLINRANEASETAFQNIPIIDFSNIKSDNPLDRRALANEVRDACFSAGFFYVKNHGIPEEVIHDVVKAGRQFFSLPVETKMKVEGSQSNDFRGYHPPNPDSRKTDKHEKFAVSWEPKELQDFSSLSEYDKKKLTGVNIWPSEDDAPGFREKVMKYYYEATELGRFMFPIFAMALNEPDDFFDDKTRYAVAGMNLLRYLPKVTPDQTGIKPHTDWGCFTILYQEPGKQALQVLNSDNEWIDAPAIPGTLVVNIGDQLSRWTNDLFKSTKHQAISLNKHDRFSIPLFFGTDNDVKMEPIPSCVSPERPWKYEVPAITAGEYLKLKAEAHYA